MFVLTVGRPASLIPDEDGQAGCRRVDPAWLPSTAMLPRVALRTPLRRLGDERPGKRSADAGRLTCIGVEPGVGFEPTTSALQEQRSAS